jgi:hypothetical protein
MTPAPQGGPPGRKGSYAVLLAPPIIEGQPRFCHLSWQGEQWVLRDFIASRLRKNGPDLSLTDIWRAARERVRLVGKLRHSVTDANFWSSVLARMSEESRRPAVGFDPGTREIDAADAAELRARLATFAADWESPEMAEYDDYESSRRELETR